MARVDNAAIETTTNLKWFKIHEDALNSSTGKWGVDNMIAQKGWAYGSMDAQFYRSCAQLNVSGSGSYVPGQTVSIPGSVSAE